MSMQDPISDMLTRIRNGQRSLMGQVKLPSSKVKVAIAKLLLDEGFIEAYQVIEGVKPELCVHLKYLASRQPVIQKIDRISKPGLRIYRHCKDLPMVMGGLGVAMISTSQGLMSDRRARLLGLGGEVIGAVA